MRPLRYSCGYTDAKGDRSNGSPYRRLRLNGAMSVPRPVSTSSWYCGHAAAIIKRGASDTAEAVGGQHRTVSNESPMWSIIIAAMHRCWPGQQCISNERITGSLEVMNAHSDTAFAHSSKLSFVQKVCLRQREQLFGTYLIQRVRYGAAPVCDNRLS